MARKKEPESPAIEPINYDEAGYQKCLDNLKNYPHDHIQYQRGLEQLEEIRAKINSKRKQVSI